MDLAANQPTILLVEDDDAVRRSLQLLLSAHGYDVMSHAHAVGLAANPKALRASYLIADLAMPQMNAIELREDLGAAGWAGKSILISGFLNQAWIGRAQAAGFDAILSKPINDSVLLRTVQTLQAAAAGPMASIPPSSPDRIEPGLE